MNIVGFGGILMADVGHFNANMRIRRPKDRNNSSKEREYWNSSLQTLGVNFDLLSHTAC